MKMALLILLFISSSALAQVLMLRDQYGFYLENRTPYYIFCTLIIPGRYGAVYWELDTGQRTPSYPAIIQWRCE